MQSKYGPKIRPIAYITQLPRITARAREHGYAITVHGSLQRDMDLVAIPWSEAASDEDELLKSICETIGGFMLENETGCDKPHGRRAWIIHLGAGLYIDLSIMPRNSGRAEAALQAIAKLPTDQTVNPLQCEAVVIAMDALERP